jgi:ATP-binding cassette subfamily B (MDR/TAP) protein 1
LFRGSVFDNIAHGLVGTPLENAPKTEQMTHVVEAARIAYADDFISQLPHGYDTDIGQRGGLLSGGQKQRIAIARSLVSNPKVLLLDEATSALDPYAEGIVQQALDRASAGRTTIVIAHKLATIRKADNIVVMSKGKIIEQGTHENLIAANGAYARLVTIQQLTVAAEDSVEDSDVETLADGEHKVIHDKEQLTRYATLEQATTDSEPEKDRYDDEGYKQLGLLTVVWRLVIEHPDLKWAYLALVAGCVVSCEYRMCPISHHNTNSCIAGLFPSQAVLMANMVQVFTLPTSEMTVRGDFFAAMFVALAGAALFSYGVMGWGTNTVAQVITSRFSPFKSSNSNPWCRRWHIISESRSSTTSFARISHISTVPRTMSELLLAVSIPIPKLFSNLWASTLVSSSLRL